MLALSIRQPYAELILRGEKTVEYRSRATRIVGERFYIYAARKWAGAEGINGQPIVASGGSANGRSPCLSGGGEGVEGALEGLWRPGMLPTGVIVGSAVIARCERGGEAGLYQWHLKDVRRYARPRKVQRRPQPVWFVPF